MDLAQTFPADDHRADEESGVRVTEVVLRDAASAPAGAGPRSGGRSRVPVPQPAV